MTFSNDFSGFDDFFNTNTPNNIGDILSLFENIDELSGNDIQLETYDGMDYAPTPSINQQTQQAAQHTFSFLDFSSSTPVVSQQQTLIQNQLLAETAPLTTTSSLITQPIQVNADSVAGQNPLSIHQPTAILNVEEKLENLYLNQVTGLLRPLFCCPDRVYSAPLLGNTLSVANKMEVAENSFKNLKSAPSKTTHAHCHLFLLELFRKWESMKSDFDIKKKDVGIEQLRTNHSKELVNAIKQFIYSSVTDANFSGEARSIFEKEIVNLSLVKFIKYLTSFFGVNDLSQDVMQDLQFAKSNLRTPYRERIECLERLFNAWNAHVQIVKNDAQSSQMLTVDYFSFLPIPLKLTLNDASIDLNFLFCFVVFSQFRSLTVQFSERELINGICRDLMGHTAFMHRRVYGPPLLEIEYSMDKQNIPPAKLKQVTEPNLVKFFFQTERLLRTALNQNKAVHELSLILGSIQPSIEQPAFEQYLAKVSASPIPNDENVRAIYQSLLTLFQQHNELVKILIAKQQGTLKFGKNCYSEKLNETSVKLLDGFRRIIHKLPVHDLRLSYELIVLTFSASLSIPNLLDGAAKKHADKPMYITEQSRFNHFIHQRHELYGRCFLSPVEVEYFTPILYDLLLMYLDDQAKSTNKEHYFEHQCYLLPTFYVERPNDDNMRVRFLQAACNTSVVYGFAADTNFFTAKLFNKFFPDALLTYDDKGILCVDLPSHTPFHRFFKNENCAIITCYNINVPGTPARRHYELDVRTNGNTTKNSSVLDVSKLTVPPPPQNLPLKRLTPFTLQPEQPLIEPIEVIEEPAPVASTSTSVTAVIQPIEVAAPVAPKTTPAEVIPLDKLNPTQLATAQSLYQKLLAFFEKEFIRPSQQNQELLEALIDSKASFSDLNPEMKQKIAMKLESVLQLIPTNQQNLFPSVLTDFKKTLGLEQPIKSKDSNSLSFAEAEALAPLLLDFAKRALHVRAHHLEASLKAADTQALRSLPCFMLTKKGAKVSVSLFTADCQHNVVLKIAPATPGVAKLLKTKVNCTITSDEEESLKTLLTSDQVLKLKELIVKEGRLQALVLDLRDKPLHDESESSSSSSDSESSSQGSSPEAAPRERKKDALTGVKRPREPKAADEKEEVKKRRRIQGQGGSSGKTGIMRLASDTPSKRSFDKHGPSNGKKIMGIVPEAQAVIEAPQMPDLDPLNFWEAIATHTIDSISQLVKREENKISGVGGEALDYPIFSAIARMEKDETQVKADLPPLNPGLKGYQKESVQKMQTAVDCGLSRILAFSVGTGKTLTFAEMIFRRLAKEKGGRILVLSPKNVVEQTTESLQQCLVTSKQTAWKVRTDRAKREKDISLVGNLARELESANDKSLHIYVYPLATYWKEFSAVAKLELETKLRGFLIRAIEKRYPDMEAGKLDTQALLNFANQYLFKNAHIDTAAYAGYTTEEIKNVSAIPAGRIVGCVAKKALEGHYEKQSSETEVVVTTVDALKGIENQSTITNRNYCALFYDEAQFVHTEKAQATKYVKELIQALNNKRADFWTQLVTATPIENNLLELWTLLSIANSKQEYFLNATQKTLSALFDDVCGRFRNGRIKQEEVVNAFVQHEVLCRIISSLLIRKTMSSEDVVKDWNNKVPQRQTIKSQGILPASVQETVDTIWKQSVSAAPSKGRKINKMISWLKKGKEANARMVHSSLNSLKNDTPELKRLLEILTPQQDAMTVEGSPLTPQQDQIVKESALLSTLQQGPELQKAIDEKKHVLITIDYTAQSHMIKAWLSCQYPGIEVQIFDGSVNPKDRKGVIEWFNDPCTDSAKILVLSNKAGGVGINLPHTDCIIVPKRHHNPSTNDQGIARGHRINSTAEVIQVVQYIWDTHEDLHCGVIQDRKLAWTRLIFDQDIPTKERFALFSQVVKQACKHSFINNGMHYENAEALELLMSNIDKKIADFLLNWDEDAVQTKIQLATPHVAEEVTTTPALVASTSTATPIPLPNPTEKPTQQIRRDNPALSKATQPVKPAQPPVRPQPPLAARPGQATVRPSQSLVSKPLQLQSIKPVQALSLNPSSFYAIPKPEDWMLKDFKEFGGLLRQHAQHPRVTSNIGVVLGHVGKGQNVEAAQACVSLLNACGKLPQVQLQAFNIQVFHSVNGRYELKEESNEGVTNIIRLLQKTDHEHMLLIRKA